MLSGEKTLDVIFTKGKGPRLEKLKIIQLIEADLQLMFRIIIGLRNNDAIKINNNVSKYNYVSRKNYSIDDEFLEKGSCVRVTCGVANKYHVFCLTMRYVTIET